MVPPTGEDGDDTDEGAAGDGNGGADAPPAEPSEVAAALDEYGTELATALADALAGRSGVVAVGVPLGLLPPVLAARERTEDDTPWRIACRSGVADALGRAFVLGTAISEAVTEEAIELRTVAGDGGSDDDRDVTAAARPLVFATPDRVDAVAGPYEDRTLVSETKDATAAAAFRAATAQFEAARPATVGMPARSRLLAAARGTLDDRFADDVAAVLDALPYGAIGRTGEITDRTLLVALAARNDHLLWDLRRWVGDGAEGGRDRSAASDEGLGIAPGQDLTDDRRALVRRGLVEAIKVPAGDGRPQLRLRAVDDALLRATPREVFSVLRGRFALPVDEDGRLRDPPGRDERRPVWKRTRRDKN
ncbi:transcriptional regulator TbsP domain-containing protein [Halorubrum sp. N11]|uniref:transcriptional regulator TbsP domain-containing protein n=1 Tax=Halorubrum sp. N11 TaxID=3402276 RepID=UPI003EC00EE5